MKDPSSVCKFLYHLCNNEKQHSRGRVWILVAAESGKVKSSLVGTLLPSPYVLDRLPKVALRHWLPLTVLFTTSNSQKGL